MKNDMLISVIVSTYNRPDALAVVLKGLLAQTDRRFEIIVADDGSTEETRKLVASFRQRQPAGPRLLHAWHADTGFRLSAVRTLGVHVASGDYLIFLDGDCVPQTNFVSRHRELAEPGYMVSGSRVLLSQRLTARFLAAADPAVHEKSLGYWLAQRLSGNINKFLPLLSFGDSAMRHYSEVKWQRIKGCNLGMWRSDYARVNGCDETFVGWGHEDADLVLRLARSGVKRKGGAFATEVFHLWHRENARATESENRKRVEERMQTGLVEAPRGLRDHPQPDEVIA
jgi:glycosyltransferase involved in cell wall biosynthesis